MAKDNTTYRDWPQDRRAVVARYGHFRIDRVFFRSKPLSQPDDYVYYGVVFEVDAGGEFDLGVVSGKRTLSPSDLRRSAFYLASIWRRAHSPPPETRPKSVPYYRRVGPDAVHNEEAPEKWIQDFALRVPDRPTIDVDRAAALIEAAMHELEETDTGEGRDPGF